MDIPVEQPTPKPEAHLLEEILSIQGRTEQAFRLQGLLKKRITSLAAIVQTKGDIEEIKNDIDLIRGKKPVVGEFPKKESRLCDFCDFKMFCFKKKGRTNIFK